MPESDRPKASARRSGRTARRPGSGRRRPANTAPDSPPPRIEVQNRQRRLPVDSEWLGQQLTEVASREGLGDRRLSVVLVSDRRMRRLNRDFRASDRTTDVLAFDYGASAETDDVSGEVIVSAETAQAEADRRGLPVEGELLLYCVHGLLHLAGYDDDSAAGRRRMWDRELAHLARAGFAVSRWKDQTPGQGH